MIVQKVVISDATPTHLFLSPVSSGCNSCSNSTCGVLYLSRIFGQARPRRLKLSNPGGFELNEEAELEIDESLFMRSVLLQYLLPLLTTLAMILIADALSPSLFMHVAFAAAGLLIGMQVSKSLIRHMEDTLSHDMFRIKKIHGNNQGINVEVIPS